MYSKKNSVFDNGDYVITPPPGYDGSRFGSRSDGRDDAFPPYDKPPQVYSPARRNRSCPTDQEKKEEAVPCEIISVEDKKIQGGLFPFLKKGIGQEELLIIALLIVLVTEREVSPELILMLGLLLCI
jgi:hypothetical protein